MTLLEQSQALRSAARDTIPVGDTLDECLAALDRVDACARLINKLGEKAAADARAGVDVDTLVPVEKAATLALVRARMVAADERDKAAIVAAEAAAAQAEEASPVAK